MSSLWFGVDLSQTALGIVAATPEIVARGEWEAMDSITIGEPGAKGASDPESAKRLVNLVEAASTWIQSRQKLYLPLYSANDVHIVFEGYPMGAGSLRGIDRVAEVGGALRCSVWVRTGVAPSSAPIASARKLLTGGLTHSMIAACHQELTPEERRQMGRDKGAIWGYLRRLGVTQYLHTPDEGDAFVALNWGLHQAGLPCLAGQGEAA